MFDETRRGFLGLMGAGIMAAPFATALVAAEYSEPEVVSVNHARVVVKKNMIEVYDEDNKLRVKIGHLN